MWMERHRCGAPAASSRRRGPQQNSNRSTVAPPEVGIIPGNRFFLLPLKKVTALVRPHTPCREPSATSTKPCIVPKAQRMRAQSQANIHGENLLRSQAHSKRLIVKQRHRRCLVVKTRLSPVSELAHSAEQELLLDQENWLWDENNIPTGVDTRSCRTVTVTNPGLQHRSRSKDTSIFTLNEPPRVESCRGAPASLLGGSSPQVIQQLDLNMSHTMAKKKKKLSNSFYNVSDIDLLRFRNSRKSHTKTRFSMSMSRNNRVSPSSLGHCDNGQQLHLRGGNCITGFGTSNQIGTACNIKRRSYSSDVGCSAAVSHQIRSSSPFLCSFTNENDLPVGPSPQLRRFSSHAGAQVEV